ncbi:MAG: EamA family transporter, partial [Cetobacterium sp.]
LFKAYMSIGPRITLLVMTFSPIAVSILSFFIIGEKLEVIKIIGMLYSILAMLAESLGIVFTRIGSLNYDSFATIQVRTIPAILAFILYISFRGRWKNIRDGFINKKGMIYIALGTTIATLGITSLVEALKYSTVGVVSTLAATSPILIIPISIIFFKEKVSILESLGALISFIGITVFFIL